MTPPALEPRYPYVHVDVASADTDRVSAELWSLGATGIEERDRTTLDKPVAGGDVVTLVASFETEAEAVRARKALPPALGPRIEHVIGDAWRDAWRAHFKPTRLGRRLVVRPSWEPFEPGRRDVVLTLDPGRAFGTGTHESTRLVLAELDRRVRGGESVLDVGCGSGILGVAALLLGASRVRAVDVDPDAVEVTVENAELNGVAARVTASCTPVSRLRGSFDLVLANIQADVLVSLAPAIAARVGSAGTLVMSGILAGQESAVRAAYRPMRMLAAPTEGEWVALVLRKSR